MNLRLRTRLVAVYLAATILPLTLTIWTSAFLLDRSLSLSPLNELDRVSQTLQRVGREYYQQARETLAADAASGRAAATVFAAGNRDRWPPQIASFDESGDRQRFETTGPGGNRLDLLLRAGNGDVRLYSRPLNIAMSEVAAEFAASRETLEQSRARDWRRGFFYTLIAVSSVVWVSGLAFLIYWANRLTRPVRRLAEGLGAVARGDLDTRIPEDRHDEIGVATAAFNAMAGQLRESREKLIRATRLESWQALARKTAHEVKNSLTPIRLTMEEIVARNGAGDEFLRQASQIVVDEVVSLERRVRAFSELASEPPVSARALDVNGVVEERVAFLKSAHPEVIYDARLDPARPRAIADPDLIKGVLTNLMENAADAARQGGTVMIRTGVESGNVAIEVHDSGPGLSASAGASLFQPTISFKKGGMGLGLSIARKSALLCGGDVMLISGELGGAAFRLVLPGATHAA